MFNLLVDDPAGDDVLELATDTIELQLGMCEAQYDAAELKVGSADDVLQSVNSQVRCIKAVQQSLEAYGNTEVLQNMFANSELDAFMPEGKTFAETEANVAIESIGSVIAAAGAKVWEFIKKLIVAIMDMLKRAFNVIDAVKKMAVAKKSAASAAWSKNQGASIKLSDVYDPADIKNNAGIVELLLFNFNRMVMNESKSGNSDPAGRWEDSFSNSLSSHFLKAPAKFIFPLDPVTFKVMDVDPNNLSPGLKFTDLEHTPASLDVFSEILNNKMYDMLNVYHAREIKTLNALQKILPKKDVSELDVKLFKQVCPEVFMEAAAATMGLSYSQGGEDDDIYRKVAADAVVKYNNFLSSVMAVASKRLVHTVLKPIISTCDLLIKALNEKSKEA